jgi:outer membrane protein OmpA-like peptidoglycan-associated protein
MRVSFFIASFFFFAFSQSFFAQKAKETYVAVYFETNQHKLTPKNEQKIDSLMKVVPFDRIYLEGYADSTGNVKYNMQLSKKRAEEIVNYIKIKHGYHNIEWTYKGQEHTDQKDLSNQRRVDIVFYKNPVKEQEQKITEVKVEKEVVKTKIIQPVKVIEAHSSDPSKDEKMNEIFTQDVIVFNNVLFEPGSDEFLHNKTPNELYYLAYALDSMPSIKIEIAGHVCCVDNLKLSEKRAKAVYQFLINQGIDKKRLSYKGYSNKQPVVKEITPEDERKNRRVEVKILER